MKLAGASIIALAACAGSPKAPSSDYVEAVWTIAPADVRDFGLTGQGAFVELSTEPGLCDRVGAHAVLPGEKTLSLELVDIAGTSTSAPAAPGTYDVPIESTLAPKTAWLGAESVDAHCALTGTGGGRGGTVDIDAIAGDTFSGSYDVGIDIGGTVTGVFNATSCPGLANALDSTLPSCQPL